MNNPNTKTFWYWPVAQSVAENKAIQRRSGELAQWIPVGTRIAIFCFFHMRRKQRWSLNSKELKENKLRKSQHRALHGEDWALMQRLTPIRCLRDLQNKGGKAGIDWQPLIFMLYYHTFLRFLWKKSCKVIWATKNFIYSDPSCQLSLLLDRNKTQRHADLFSFLPNISANVLFYKKKK